MKTIIVALFLTLLVGASGCGKHVSKKIYGETDIAVRLSWSTNGVRYSICNTPLSYHRLDTVLGKARSDLECFRREGRNLPDMGLVLLVDPRVAVTNILPAVILAEKHQITNIVVKLKWINPPTAPDER